MSPNLRDLSTSSWIILHKPPLNEDSADKIHEYRADYNKLSSNSISFMPVVAITSGGLHCESVRILFL
jgi:hypothetical protein